MDRSSILVWLIGSMLMVSSCISTEQIQATSPRPASTGLVSANSAGMGAFSVTVTTGGSSLPGEVQALRFSIDEIHLRSKEGEWKVMPVELNNFEILPNRELTKNILSTRVETMAYDSIAISISDVFVLYSESAGGPIAWPRETPSKEALSVSPNVDVPTRVRIVLEPGASLLRDKKCQWYFVPFWITELF